MSLFKDMLDSSDTLFKNDLALDFSFQPKILKYREEQQRQIAECIKPLFQNRNGKNLFIYGLPGIGKTLATRKVLEDLEEQSDEIDAIYINCWHKNTTFKVFLELCTQLGYRLTHNKSSDDLFKIIKEILNKRQAVIVFDEIDKVEDFDFLYSILEDVYRKTIVLITNYKEWITNIEERVRSRLAVDKLEFQPYNPKETEGILKQRVEWALVPNTLEEDAFKLILNKTVEVEDIRAGLTLVKEATNNAEARSSKKVQAKDAELAINNLDQTTLHSSDSLGEDPKMILNIIKENDKSKMGDLFKLYEKKGGKSSYRSFFRRVKKLAEDKFVSLEKIEGGKDGNTTIVSYANLKKLDEF